MMSSRINILAICLTVVLHMVLVEFGFSQLSGTYTLGNASSDYATFYDAINDIKSQGLAGDVEFLVKPGSYHNISLNSVENPDGFKISFAYDQTTNDSALLIGKLKVINSPYVSFNGFSIYPTQGQYLSVVSVDNSTYFSLENCKILNIYNNEFDDDEGLISINFPWDGPYFVANITNCTINSEENAFFFNGKKGSVWIRNNIITGNVNDRYGYVKKHYHDNIFYCIDYDFTNGGQTFYNNTFYLESNLNLNIQGDLFGNTFFTNVKITSTNVMQNIFYEDAEMLRCDNASVTANVIYKDAKMLWCNNASVTANIIYGKFRTTYSHGIKIRGNVFYDNVNFTNDNTWFGSNLLFDTVSFSHGPGQMIFNNNFHKNSYLELHYTGGRMKNNNLANLYIVPVQISSWIIENNNFVNLGNGNVCCYGDEVHFYDPMYNPEIGLHASNPLLIAKGGDFNSKFKYDIDSVLRKEPCTIGANEICFDWEVNEVDLMCSDSLQLDLCLDTLVDMYWSPAYLFDDSTSANPLIFPEHSTIIYLHQSNGTILDSLIINTSEVQPVAYANYSREGLTVSFDNKSVCADSYLWNFGDGISSADESPVHTYETDGSYQCTLTASNYLGDAYWSVLLNVVSLSENLAEPNSFVVFPNPANGFITVKSKNYIYSLAILNFQGQIVYTEKFNGIKEYKIDMSPFPKGSYLIKVQSDNVVSTKVFVNNAG